MELYEACDKAIKEMNRQNLAWFNNLKLAKWDEVSIVRKITETYRKARKTAKRKYYEIAFEAYVLGLLMCDVEPKKAHEMAEKAISPEWVEVVLERTDPLTLYRFNSETDRKIQRLMEAMAVLEGMPDREEPWNNPVANRNAQIDSALRAWSKQLGQYAINMTDYAIMQAFEDMDVPKAQWVIEEDEKTCRECRALNGKIFKLEDFPPKPHYGCRCRRKPVFGKN